MSGPDRLAERASNRLQLVMSPAEADRMEAIRDATESASLGEVLRRALQLAERLVAEGVPLRASWHAPSGRSRSCRTQVATTDRGVSRLGLVSDALGGAASMSESARVALEWYAAVATASLDRAPFPALRADGTAIDCTGLLAP